MLHAKDDDRHAWALQCRAGDILDGRANGLAEPILRMLANRGYMPATVELARRFESLDHGIYTQRGRQMVQRCAVRGDYHAASSLAVDYRNRGMTRESRRWLHHAARLGDEYAARELRKFRTRWPFESMKRLKRYAGRDPSWW